MDDCELLRQFAGGSREAFADLARRYADLVYSAALRQTRNSERAQDVAQAVFVLLARKAPQLRSDVILSAWLFKAVRLVAREQARADRRRVIREQKAAMMRHEATTPEPNFDETEQWAGVSPLLDEGINRLPERYRVPLLLRFFEGRSFAELAAKLGLTEAAARQRVHRAISKLRTFLTRRGVNVTAGALSTGLTNAALHAAPPTVVSAATAAPALVGGTALALAHGTLAAVAFVRAKALAVVAASATVAAAALTVVTVELKDRAAPPARVVSAASVAAPAPAQVNRPPRQTIRRVVPRSTIGQGAVPPLITGMVVDGSGHPLPGADVMIVTPRRPLWVNNRQWFGGLRMTTDADGAFSFPPQDGPWELVACNENGFLHLSQSQALSPAPLKLPPWARVEGTLWVHGQPAPDGEVHISNGTLVPSWAPQVLLYDTVVKTDAHGHFEFPQVVPGEVWVNRQFREKRGTHANFVFASAEAGKTLHVDVGLGGGSISGKVAYEGDPSDAPSWTVRPNRSYSARLIRTQTTTAPQVPQPQAGMSQDQVNAFYRAWEQSDAGRAARRAMVFDDFPIDPDGTFHFEGVRPGDYILEVSTFEVRPGQLSAEVITTGRTQLKMSETDARAGQSLNLGTFTVRPVPRVKIGAALPELNATTLYGKSFDLSRFKGKPILLHFWGLGNLDQIDLESIRHWAASDRVTAIGVNSYDDPAAASAQAGARHMDWPQIRVPSMWPSASNWVRPGETILIDSAGVVIARHSLGQTTDTVTPMLHSMGVSP